MPRKSKSPNAEQPSVPEIPEEFLDQIVSGPMTAEAVEAVMHKFRTAAKVPESVSFQTKGDIALAQIDAALADGVRFGTVVADAGYGSSAAFRAELTQRELRWAVGVQPTQKVYPGTCRA